MKRLPDDFNVNILLPGAVWLLISVLAGRVAVARLETDAITVVMFVVISLVIFIVPMAVYMEYRKKIEQLSERKSKKASSPSGSGSSGKSQSTTEPETACRFSFPPDFPDALKGDRTMIFMEALRHEGFLDAEYRPHDGCNATQMAFIADSIAANLQHQSPVEDFWRLLASEQYAPVVGCEEPQGFQSRQRGCYNFHF